MVRFLLALIILIGCSAEDMTAVTEPMRRIDGHPMNDGIFLDDAERERLCEGQDPVGWCAPESEYGVASQPWTSAEYHGANNGAPCYGTGSNGGDCNFPALKQMKILFNTDECYNNTVPLLKAQKMVIDLKFGMMLWNGAGAGVTVEDGTCAWPACMTVPAACADLDAIGYPGSLGACGLDGVSTVRVNDLPVGPHGNNQAKARVTSTLFCKFDLQNIWNFMTQPIGAPLYGCGLTGTNAQVAKFAQYIGAHEMGHNFAFAHFGSASSLMYPYTGCNPPAPTIQQEYKDALGAFNSAGSATGQVLDYNLERWSP